MTLPAIRPARMDEYDEVARVWMESWATVGIEPASAALLEKLRARLRAEVAKGWSLYVADDGGRLAAMLALHVSDNYLDQLFVAPEYQGKSVGRMLLAFTHTLLPDEIWLRHPGLNGHPAGVGWGSGRACVVSCECELARVSPGDILVTRVAGPALSQILPRVAGVVAELGGSTSHLASLARERGIPMVLGVLDATQRIPDGVQIAVDGVGGNDQRQRLLAGVVGDDVLGDLA